MTETSHHAQSRPLYIFDLDDTLAITSHRQHLISGASSGRDKKNWHAYFAECEGDTPNQPVIETLKQLRLSGAEAWIWSGRMDSVRAQTVRWLVAHAGFESGELDSPCILRMRDADDWTADHLLKQRWLGEMQTEDRARLIAVFDDRDRVVDMFRRRQISCFQVNYGNF